MSGPNMIQRVEGCAVFVTATIVYFHNDFSWILYLLLIFSFDLFMIGYLFNPKTGALIYNIGHSFVTPSLLIIIYLITDDRHILGLACLWFAHIGIDRGLGYGLKLTSGFKNTHLGNIGKH